MQLSDLPTHHKSTPILSQKMVVPLTLQYHIIHSTLSCHHLFHARSHAYSHLTASKRKISLSCFLLSSSADDDSPNIAIGLLGWHFLDNVLTPYNNLNVLSYCFRRQRKRLYQLILFTTEHSSVF